MRINRFKNELNAVLAFCFFGALTAVPSAYAWTEAVWGLVWLLPGLLLTVVIRNRVKKAWLFLLLHGAALGIPLLLPLSLGKLLTVYLQLILLVSYSFYFKFKPPSYPHTLLWPGVLVCAADFFIGWYAKLPHVQSLTAVFLYVMLIVTPLLRHMQTVEESLNTLYGGADTPNRRSLTRGGARVAGLYAAVLAAGLPLIPLAASDAAKRLADKLKDLILRVLLWLLSLLPARERPADPVPSVAPPISGELELPPAEESPEAMQYLAEVLLFLTAAAAAVLIIWLLVRLIRLFFQNFQTSGAKTVLENKDVEELLDTLPPRGRKARDFGTGEERRIRRLYYQTVKKKVKPLPRPSDTAREILENHPEAERLPALTDDYERVRYGNFPAEGG